MLTSQFVGYIGSVGMLYNYGTWYFLTLPFLLDQLSPYCSWLVQVALFYLIDWAWQNHGKHPGSLGILASLILQGVHLVILGALVLIKREEIYKQKKE